MTDSRHPVLSDSAMSPGRLTALSLGAGVQSTTLALLAVEGVLPLPDVAIFADTGWEPAAVYDHLARLTSVLAEAGVPVHVVSYSNLRDDVLSETSRFLSIPFFVRNADGTQGLARRQCTHEYKLVPIRRELRRMLGASAPAYRRVPTGRSCEQWVGFSTDEVHRANRHKDSGGVSYINTRYPLLDLGLSRSDCERWLRTRGWTTTKSACIGCPFHGNRAWREMRDERPEEWADAVEFDAAIRTGGARSLPHGAHAFLHRSMLPLADAPIDKVTAGEWRERQTDIFGQLADLDEDGDLDGCSPYGCRSERSASA